jgi:hypothetical protein
LSEVEAAAGRSRCGGALAPALLAAAAAVGALCVLAPLAHWAIAPKILPSPLGEQNQSTETLLMVLAFVVVLPAALVASLRLVPALAAASGPRAPDAAAGLLASALVAALLLVRGSSQLPWGYGLGPLLVAALGWWALCAFVIARGLSGWRALERLPDLVAGTRARVLAGVLGAAGMAAALAVSIPGSVDVGLLVALAVVSTAVVVAYGRVPLPPLGRPWGPAADFVVIVLLVLAVVNVVIFLPEDPSEAFTNRIIQFHQDFFLGPANHVLGGEPMLVGTYSQYGVSSIYLIAGWFHLAPQGNGTLGFLDGVLQGCVFAAGYGVLRLARVPRLLAAGAMLVAVLVLVLSLVYPVGALLQHGAIRFGMPMLVVLLATAAARFPGRSTLRGAILAVVALASTWALEAFAYTLLTVAALIALDVVAAPAGDRRRRAIGAVAAGAAAVIAAQIAFALITLAAAGELPGWGHYLTILREFLTGGIGDLTYDFAPWSSGLAVGALYLASAAGIVAVLARRRDLLDGEPALLTALTGTTAYGIALFTYLDNRSAAHIVAFVSLPALLAATLWIALALRPGSPLRPSARRSLLAAGLGVSAVMIAAGASSIPTRWDQSALAHVVPGGDSLPTALRRLWHPPPFEPGVDQGVALLDAEMPGAKPIVMTSADLGIEILAKSQRSNAVPLGDPWEDSFVPDQHLDELAGFVDSLEAGDRMLIDRPAADAFRVYRAEPERDPIEDPVGGEAVVPTGVAVLQEWLLKEIGKRFDLDTVATADDGSGVSVVQLVPRH